MSDEPHPCSCYANAIRITELEKRLVSYQEFQRESLTLASSNLAIRMEHANGLIAQMKDQSARWVPREEYTVELKAVRERIGEILGKLGTMQGQDVRLAFIASAIGALAGFMAAFFVRKFGG